jgi:hypothetical protein
MTKLLLKKVFLVLLIGLSLTSCKKEAEEKLDESATEIEVDSITDEVSSPEEVETTMDEANTDETTSSETSDCDQFLVDYEDFVTKYIEVLKKFKENPKNPSILLDYTSMMSEVKEWSNKIKDCANDPILAAKFAKIQMKIAAAAN